MTIRRKIGLELNEDRLDGHPSWVTSHLGCDGRVESSGVTEQRSRCGARVGYEEYEGADKNSPT